MLKRPETKLNVQAILDLADYIEKLPDYDGSIPIKRIYDVVDTDKVDLFNMRVLTATTECGTCCCIAGTAEILFGDEWSFGLNDKQCDELFMPKGYATGIYKAKDAAQVLRHLALTGEVDWSITGKYPD